MYSLLLPLSIFALVHSETNVKTIATVETTTVFDDPCQIPLKIGKPSNGDNATHSYKFFFDNKINRCFKYRSEGGNDSENSFESEESCRYRCIPMDFFTCGGNAPSTGSCSQFDPTAPKCPAGSFCKNGGMSSMCCSTDIEKAFEKEYNPSCPSGTIVKEKVWFGEDVVRGRACSDNFCPNGTECHQGEWISFCCRK